MVEEKLRKLEGATRSALDAVTGRPNAYDNCHNCAKLMHLEFKRYTTSLG